MPAMSDIEANTSMHPFEESFGRVGLGDFVLHSPSMRFGA